MRWAFIRKVYVIVAMQMLVTVAAVCFVPAIRQFFAERTPAVFAAFVVIILAPIIGESIPSSIDDRIFHAFGDDHCMDW
jgi:FtsH-binding integral membrane protein